MTFRRRLEFTSETKRQAFARSGGVCECHLVPWIPGDGCGCKLGPGNTFYEHINPDAIRSDNSIDNCAVLTKTCWRYKTSHYDLPVIAKSDRVRDRNRSIKTITKPLPGARSDPFKFKIGQFGPQKVVDRVTGKPWGRS